MFKVSKCFLTLFFHSAAVFLSVLTEDERERMITFSNVATSAEFGRTDLRQLIFAIVKSDDFAIPETSFLGH